jgi:hypothetical protein
VHVSQELNHGQNAIYINFINVQAPKNPNAIWVSHFSSDGPTKSPFIPWYNGPMMAPYFWHARRSTMLSTAILDAAHAKTFAGSRWTMQ